MTLLLGLFSSRRTPAVYSYCGGLGHGEYNCLQSMFDARGPTGVSMGVDLLVGVQIPVLLGSPALAFFLLFVGFFLVCKHCKQNRGHT